MFVEDKSMAAAFKQPTVSYISSFSFFNTDCCYVLHFSIESIKDAI